MALQQAVGVLSLLLLVNNVMASGVNSSEDVVLSTPGECARNCVAGGAPKVCYYKFHLENYNVLNGACELCIPQPNNSFTAECQCVWADGVERSIMTVNRIIPGPSIEVCLGDKIVVDMENNIAGNAVTIHWHGIFQNGTPHMDGVPLLTQCAVHQGNTFRYQFMADNAGTHFWHAHTALQKLNGITGTLIVREPKSLDVHGHLYDYDNTSSVIFVYDWFHELAEQRLPGRIHSDVGQVPKSLLINGKGNYRDPNTGRTTKIPLEVLNVKKGKKYRFRFINGFCNVCPAQFNIQGHNFTIIAIDGEPVEPVTVDTLMSVSGERYDFIINANKDIGTYWIQLKALGECEIFKIQQLALLKYEGGLEYPREAAPKYDRGLPVKKVMNPMNRTSCANNNDNAVCINELRYAGPVDESLFSNQPDVTVPLNFRIFGPNPSDLFAPQTYMPYMIGGFVGDPNIFQINGIVYTAPPSPMLTQYNDIDPKLFCNSTNKPDNCVEGEPCHCAHKINIPLNALVEIVLIDEDGIPDLHHPFHLHGQTYAVVAMGNFGSGQRSECQRKRIIDAARQVGLNRTLSKPPKKDTLAVPVGGFLILRFRATNPGFWLFHCHFVYHTDTGMEVVFQVGNLDQMPPIPDGFPKCGNFAEEITHA